MNDTKISFSKTLKHLGSIWYHSEPSDVPHTPDQFLGWAFFAVSYSKPAPELYTT